MQYSISMDFTINNKTIHAEFQAGLDPELYRELIPKFRPLQDWIQNLEPYLEV